VVWPSTWIVPKFPMGYLCNHYHYFMVNSFFALTRHLCIYLKNFTLKTNAYILSNHKSITDIRKAIEMKSLKINLLTGFDSHSYVLSKKPSSPNFVGEHLSDRRHKSMHIELQCLNKIFVKGN